VEQREINDVSGLHPLRRSVYQASSRIWRKI